MCKKSIHVPRKKHTCPQKKHTCPPRWEFARVYSSGSGSGLHPLNLSTSVNFNTVIWSENPHFRITIKTSENGILGHFESKNEKLGDFGPKNVIFRNFDLPTSFFGILVVCVRKNDIFWSNVGIPTRNLKLTVSCHWKWLNVSKIKPTVNFHCIL